MKKNNNIRLLIISFFWFSNTLLQAQTLYKWHKLPSPVYSGFKQIQFVNQDTAIISGKQLLLYDGININIFKPQPDCKIEKAFAVNSHCIYVSDNSYYQNSSLYHWNGKKWSEIENPMANNIINMFFTDCKNGALSSFGEIAILNNGKWRLIKPPTNRTFSGIIQLGTTLFVSNYEKGIYKYDKTWTPVNNSIYTHNIFLINNRVYAIGKDFLGIIQDDKLIKLNEHKVWNDILAITKQNDTIIGVGKKGKIIYLINNSIVTEKNKITQNLNRIISQNKSLWVVGEEGTIINNKPNEQRRDTIKWKGFEQLTFNNHSKIIDDEYGVIAADFDNDGWTDIFTCGLFEPEHLYFNHKNLIFIENKQVFNQSNTKHNAVKELNLGACAGDLDNDGYIDIYLCLLNGENKIFKNIKGKYFIDYSTNAGGTGKAGDRTNAAIMGDIDNDGDLDIFITNEFSTNRLYLNNGAGIFTEITKKAGLESIEGGNSATFGDIDNDGDLDLYITNWSSENKLYQNQYSQTGKIQFIDYTKESNTAGLAYTKSNAAVFSDVDNDGDLDLFVTNRKSSNKLYININNGVYKDMTTSLIGSDSYESYGAVIADFDGDSYKDIYISNVGDNVFYKNEKGVFINQTTKYEGLVKGYSTGSAVSDFDNDGDLDLYIANYVGAGSTLLRNRGVGKNSITLNVKGVLNNTCAIGTKIFVYAASKTEKILWFDEIRAGTGYVSVNDFKKIIPIQNHKNVQVKIVFPNGITKVYKNVSAGNHLYISDTTGFQKKMVQIKHYILRHLLDPLEFYGLIKWIFVILMLSISGLTLQRKYHWNPFYPLVAGLLLLIFYYLQYKTFKYSSFLYATILPLSGMIGIVLLSYYFFEQYYIRKMSIIEKNKIRQRLSRDLHDDLSATISSVGFYLTLIRFGLKEKNKKVLEAVKKSEELIEDASDTISNLIWSINPKPETIQNLFLRLHQIFNSLLKNKHIEFVVEKDSPLLLYKLTGNYKQHIFLILKEALNNSIKYAAASRIVLSIHKKNNKISISLTDNGKGFNYTKALEIGNGLNNMQIRALEINAKLSIKSAEKKGTSINITFNIP